MVAARDARRRTGSSGKIIPKSQCGGEHASAEVADGKERDEHSSASSRRDGSRLVSAKGARTSLRCFCSRSIDPASRLDGKHVQSPIQSRQKDSNAFPQVECFRRRIELRGFCSGGL
jgi:hypothetical protein